MTPSCYAAIILAAGRSSRMEAFKPLLPLRGETLTDRAISLFAQNGCDVLFVVGWNKDVLLAGMKDKGITVVENPDYDQGMFTSVQAGIRRLEPRHEAFFVMPVDIPLVRPFTVRRLLNEAATHPGHILYPTFGMKRGHPTLIPSDLIPAIAAWQEDGGLKTCLQSRSDLAHEVPVPDRHILFDIDTMEDYREALARLHRYDIATAAECDVIMNVIYPMPPNIRRHCSAVAEAALSIGRGLQQCGRDIDLVLLRTAALLHDVARKKPDHAKAGAQILCDMGFDKVGDTVAVHTDLMPTDGRPISLEAKVLFLADKLVENDKRVSLEERYRTWNRRFEVTPEIAAKILQGKARAQAVKQEFETILHCPLEDIIGMQNSYNPAGRHQERNNHS